MKVYFNVKCKCKPAESDEIQIGASCKKRPKYSKANRLGQPCAIEGLEFAGLHFFFYHSAEQPAVKEAKQRGQTCSWPL